MYSRKGEKQKRFKKFVKVIRHKQRTTKKGKTRRRKAESFISKLKRLEWSIFLLYIKTANYVIISRMEKLKLMLVDDQSLFTESLCTFLNNYAEDMRVVSKACNGREAVKFCEIEKPDVILMDINMPEMNGIEAVKIIKSKHPEVLIIMLSTYDEDAYVREALLSGASGYLLKDLSPTELIMSIRALKSGVLQISPSIVQKMIQAQFVGSSSSDGDEKNSEKTKEADENLLREAAEKKFEWLKTLTKRERQIFALIATGHDNDEIAQELDLALQTVRNQVSTIYSKLGVKDRFEIIKLANKV